MDQHGSTNCIGSWAIETEDPMSSETLQNGGSDIAERSTSSYTPSRKNEDSSPSVKNRQAESLDKRDLRHRLRGNRHGDDDDSENSHRPNYRREKDGLSPLRSPLTVEQRSSGSHKSDCRRRGSARDERRSKKGDTTRQSVKNTMSYTMSSPPRSNRDSDEGTPVLSRSLCDDKYSGSRSRRRLNLPSERDSDIKEEGALNSDIDEDQVVLARREKQISYGKRTESYQQYIATVPRDERCVDRKKHPRTPIKWRRCSRRNFDAQIKAWKKYLHEWAKDGEDVLDLSSPLRPLLTDSMVTEAGTGTPAEEKVKMEEENSDDNELELDLEDDSFLEGFELHC